MRDRNLSFDQFHIQLEKNISLILRQSENRRISFSQELSLEFRPSDLHSEPVVFYPRDFRLLRALSISFWYFPQNLHFLVKISLEQESFSWLTSKQQLELSLLLSSKENMEKYLFLSERFTGNEIFGNILGNDLKELTCKMKVLWKYYPRPRRKIRRRGPKDKGSRRVNSTSSQIAEEIRKDIWIQTEEEKRQRKRKLLHLTSLKIQHYLERSVEF